MKGHQVMKEYQVRSGEDILHEYAAATGWDAASMLALALEYIDHLDTDGRGGLGSGDAFRSFVRERAAEEVARADA